MGGTQKEREKDESTLQQHKKGEWKIKDGQKEWPDDLLGGGVLGTHSHRQVSRPDSACNGFQARKVGCAGRCRERET